MHHEYDEGARMTKEQQVQLGPQTAQWPPSSLNSALTLAAPINEQIRALISDVADAADVVSERRENASSAAKQLAEAEMRFSDLAGRMAQLLANHRALGDPNAPKNILPR